ncbi:MAG: HDOD domain-containing protein [Thermoguttaceae bacterium]
MSREPSLCRDPPDPHTEPPEVLVERLFARISEVSTLPALALKIIEVAKDPNASAADLYEVVRRDVALAVRIMRTVNSSYYSLKTKVADLQLAITLLGFEHVRNLALTAYVARLFKGQSGHGRYRREGLWNHLIGTGAVAMLVAETCGKVPPREAYLAGLFHDVGFVLLDQYLHKPFCQLVDAVTEDAPVCRVEHEILGFDHTQLGAFAAQKWDLPEQLVVSIRHHHAPASYHGPCQAMLYVVTLANAFSSLRGYTSLGVRSLQMPPSVIFSGLGLGTGQVESIWQQSRHLLLEADIQALARVGKP